MLFYWLLLVGIAAAGILLSRIRYGRTIFCILAGAALWVTAGIRRGVGYDYNLYGGWYVDLIKIPMEEVMYKRQEKGFLVPFELMSTMTTDYQLMFWVIAFVITGSVMLYIFFHSEKPWLSVFCFMTFGLFFNSMNFMRQMIASCILLLAMRYVRRKQFIPYLVLVIFASAFHVSAFLMIPFYFILQIKMNGKVLIAYSVVTLLFFLFSWDILDFFNDYIYKGYTITNAEVTNGTNPVYVVFFILFFAAAFAVRKELMKTDEFNNVLLNCMFFTVFFEIMGVRHAILSRFSLLFFIPAIVILVPRVIVIFVKRLSNRFINDKTKYTAVKITAIAFVAVICGTMYTYMIANNYNGVTPYTTIYSEE